MKVFYKLEEWCNTLEEVFFTPVYFIYEPKYSRNRRNIHVLTHFYFYLGRQNWILTESTDVVSIKGLLKSHIKIEFTFYNDI